MKRGKPGYFNETSVSDNVMETEISRDGMYSSVRFKAIGTSTEFASFCQPCVDR